MDFSLAQTKNSTTLDALISTRKLHLFLRAYCVQFTEISETVLPIQTELNSSMSVWHKVIEAYFITCKWAIYFCEFPSLVLLVFETMSRIIVLISLALMLELWSRLIVLICSKGQYGKFMMSSNEKRASQDRTPTYVYRVVLYRS